MPRLYPATEDPRLLEVLASVPAGTAAQLQALSAERQAAERLAARLGERALSAAEDETAELIAADPDLRRLHALRTEGWGRIPSLGRRMIAASGLASDAGGTDQPDTVRLILLTQFGPGPRVAQTASLLLQDGGGLWWC